MDLDNRLRIFRKELNLSQQEMADNIGVDRSAISNYERGATIPEPIIIILELKYNLNKEWLKEGIGEIFTKKNYDIKNPNQTIEETLSPLYMNPEIEDLKVLVKELMQTVRDQASSIKDNAAAEKDNARTRLNLSETNATQARTIENLTSQGIVSKKGRGVA